MWNLLAFCSGSPAPFDKYHSELMTSTFENDNDVMVYAIEKSISYATKNRYMFVAPSIWWIASVSGLTEGLVIYIEQLQLQGAMELVGISAIDQPHKVGVITPSNILDRLNGCDEPFHIHPDWISQIGNTIGDGDSRKNSDSESAQASRFLKSGKEFIDKSKNERKSLRENTVWLTLTRLGNISKKCLSRKHRNCLRALRSETLAAYVREPLSQKQKNCLRAVPSETLAAYLSNRE